MSRVARSARVGSRQRTEAITASKTVQSAETGELYFINSNAAAIVITLPALQDGAYFKFVIGDELVNLDTKSITIQSAGGALTGGEMVGSSHSVLGGGTLILPTNGSAAKGDNHYQFVVDSDASGNKLFAGSCIECWSDGSYWYVSSVLRTDASTTEGNFAG